MLAVDDIGVAGDLAELEEAVGTSTTSSAVVELSTKFSLFGKLPLIR